MAAEIDMDELKQVSLTSPPKPRDNSWSFPLIYRESLKGVLFHWRIAYVKPNLITQYGTKNKPQLSTLHIELNESGKNLSEQAYLQASKKFRDKFDEGYRLPGAKEPAKVKAMKGHRYEKGCIKSFPVLLSTKLNGVRILAGQDMDGDVHLSSYSNKSFDYLTIIKEQVTSFMPYLPTYCTLDGEAYCHGMTFHEITSAVRTLIDQHKDIEWIKFYIFDIYFEENPPSDQRYKILYKAFQAYKRDGGNCNNLVLVPHWYAYSHDEIIRAKDKAVKRGYEGLVVRRCCKKGAAKSSLEYKMSQYSFSRSKRIFKVKDFIDEEGTVVRVESATGREKDLALLIVKDRYGFEVPIRIGGEEERKRWLKKPKEVIGKRFTFKHYGRHPRTNIAQNPTGIGFRDYE